MRLKGRERELREPLALNFSQTVDVGKGLGTWKELKNVFNSFCGTFNGVLISGLSGLMSKELGM